MKLLLKTSSVGVSRDSMEKEEAEGVGEDGDANEVGRDSLLLRGHPSGIEGVENSLFRVWGCNWVLGDPGTAVRRGELCGEGLWILRRSVLGERWLTGLLRCFKWSWISSAKWRRVPDASVVSSTPAGLLSAARRDNGSKPDSIPVRCGTRPWVLLKLTLRATLQHVLLMLVSVATVQLVLLSAACLCGYVVPVASSTSSSSG